MKNRGCVVAMFALAFAFAPQLFETSTAAPQQKGGDGKGEAFTAKLISPRAGDVLIPGQQVRIEWESTLPHVDLTWCEQEIYLSLDGGKSNATRLTLQLDPRIGYYNWTVPNTPSSAAVLDIHFGCEGYFSETASVQSESVFVIARTRRTTQEVAINSISAAQASPGDEVQISWESSVENVKYFELQVSYDRGAHFHRLAKTKELQFAWEVPDDFAGHATFRVVAYTAGGGRVDSAISAEPQVIVRARPE